MNKSDINVNNSSRSSLNRNDFFANDLEACRTLSIHLDNDSVQSFSWRDVGVVVKDRRTKKPLSILSSAYGHVKAGEVVALIGPSGSGKTTLLNVLANRVAAPKANVSGDVLVNGQTISRSTLRKVSSYVEQEDALIGSLTVRETVDFAARLALPSSVSRKERASRVEDLLASFGMQGQANSLVGTPIRKGISGGQKRRLSVASQLVTSPKILFLDEPTSGLDSAASFEVMKFIKNLARRHKVIVVASIHQPSTTTFELFDQLLLLSAGKTCYFGPVDGIQSYFAAINQPIPLHINPAEFMLDLVNADFVKKDENTSLAQLQGIHEAWGISQEFQHLTAKLNRELSPSNEKMASKLVEPLSGRTKLLLPITLLHRNFIKSYRDVIPYGVRLAMYMGLAIMVGTVWLRLSYHQSSIQPFISALFFGSAFMSFMAVAYVPAVIEDLHTLRKERANGLYGPLPFVIANFLIGIPYLFLISLFFSVVPYWLSNFRPTAHAFSTWVMWLFLDLLAAEGLVVLVTSFAPLFVAALAVTAFANGLWMSVSGFMVPVGTLNVFWKYVFHYIDYQAYVFQGMMVNQFEDTVWDCDVVSSTHTWNQPQYNCMYPSDLQSQGQIRGTAVLQTYGYETGKTGKWVGIMLGIIVAYRVLGYFALKLRKN